MISIYICLSIFVCICLCICLCICFCRAIQNNKKTADSSESTANSSESTTDSSESTDELSFSKDIKILKLLFSDHIDYLKNFDLTLSKKLKDDELFISSKLSSSLIKFLSLLKTFFTECSKELKNEKDFFIVIKKCLNILNEIKFDKNSNMINCIQKLLSYIHNLNNEGDDYQYSFNEISEYSFIEISHYIFQYKFWDIVYLLNRIFLKFYNNNILCKSINNNKVINILSKFITITNICPTHIKREYFKHFIIFESIKEHTIDLHNILCMINQFNILLEDLINKLFIK
jgi:hypothetical protein